MTLIMTTHDEVMISTLDLAGIQALMLMVLLGKCALAFQALRDFTDPRVLIKWSPVAGLRWGDER